MKQRKAELLLVSVALVWGASGTLMKIGIGDLSPFSLIFLRFGIAFLLMVLLFRRRVFPPDRGVLLRSALMGGAMFLTFTFLLFGLKTTSASTAGFLTGTAVVMVPLLELLLFRKKPRPTVWAAMVLVLIGVALLSLKEGLTIGPGGALCLVASAFNASYIVMTARFSKQADPLCLGVWQLFIASALALAAAAGTSALSLPRSRAGWVTVLGLALFCSAYGYVIQPVAQRETTPEKAGFILTLEPVFSLLFAGLILQEAFTAREALGACLIFISILVVNRGEKPNKQEVVK